MADSDRATFNDAYGNEYVRTAPGCGYWKTINLEHPPKNVMIHPIQGDDAEEQFMTENSEPPKQSEQDHLLEARGLEYADAWIVTSEVVGYLMEHGHFNVLGRLIGKDSPYIYAWITILCKLIRALQSPRKADHWRDIAGYAILVAEHIETGSRGR